MHKWGDEVASLSSAFRTSAAAVSRWDAAVAASEAAVTSLHRDALVVSEAQAALRAELDAVEAQQEELGALVGAMEAEAARVYGGVGSGAGGDGGGGGGAAGERRRLYDTASGVQRELDGLAEDVAELVKEMNGVEGGGSGGGGTTAAAAAAAATDGSGDVLPQVVAVLNAHLNSLEYLEDNAAALQRKVRRVRSAVEEVGRERGRASGGGGRRLGGRR